MKFIEKNISRIGGICYLILMFIILSCIIVNGINENTSICSYLILSVICVSIVIVVIRKMKELSIFFKIGIVLSLIISISILFISYNPPYSDYSVFFQSAKELFSGNIMQAQYISVFPHYWGYITFLGILFKIFSSNYIIVIISNLVFNYLTSLLLYKFLKKNYNLKTAQIGTLIYLLNPINIIWCVFSYNSIIFNFFLMLTIYFISKIYKIDSFKKFVTSSIIVGICLGLANQFRPIVIILYIALAIYIVYKIVVEKSNYKFLISSLIMVLIVMTGVNKIFSVSEQLVTGIKVTKNSSGFSLFVGSNTLSNGTWTVEDSEVFVKEYEKKPFDTTEIQTEMQKRAIERYKDNGWKNIFLLKEKFNILTTKLGQYSYNEFYNITNGSLNSNIYNLVLKTSNLFYYMLIIFNILLGIVLIKKNNYKDLLLLVLFIGGFTIASLLLEVSPRYYLPAIVPLTILGTIGISKFGELEFKIKNVKR